MVEKAFDRRVFHRKWNKRRGNFRF